MFKNRISIFLAIVPACVLLDQFSKLLIAENMKVFQSIDLIGNWFRITFVYNTGMVWGMRPQNIFPHLPVTMILTIFMSIASSVLISYYFFYKENQPLTHTGLALIISGALGNLADRFFLGKVIDFVDVGISETLRWPVWNFADAFITVGVGLVLLSSFLAVKRTVPSNES